MRRSYLYVSSASAQNYTWTGATGNWATSSNWSPALTTFNGTTNIFFEGSGATTMWIGGGKNIRSLNFTGTSNATVDHLLGLGANPDGSGAGNLNFNSSNTTLLDIATGVSSNITIGTTGGNIVLVNYDLTIDHKGSGELALARPITSNVNVGNGTTGVTFTGGGNVTLSATNTYNGTTTVDSGRLLLNAGNITLSPTVNINNDGTLQLGGTSDRLATTAALTINEGGTLTLNKNQQVGSLNGAGNLRGSAGNFTLTVSEGTFSGNFTGTNGLTKTGSGNLTLSGNNSYSGNTTITGGILLMNSGSISSTIVDINNGGTLRIGGSGSRLNTNTALTVNAGGTFDLRKNQQIASLNGAGDVSGSVAAYSLTVGSGNFTGNFTGLNGITKTGNGTLTLSGVNTYTGNTTVSDGTLALSGGSALSNSGILLIVSPGVVNVTGNETVAQLFIGGIQQAAGNYTSSNPRFTGSGTLIVLNGAAGGYDSWNDNIGNQTADLDYDGDGIDNGAEYFMGTAGNAFTPNPQPVAGVITWPIAGVSGASAIVQVSNNLSAWTNAATTFPGSVNTSNPAQIQFTVPTGQGKLFYRLSVTIP